MGDCVTGRLYLDRDRRLLGIWLLWSGLEDDQVRDQDVRDLHSDPAGRARALVHVSDDLSFSLPDLLINLKKKFIRV